MGAPALVLVRIGTVRFTAKLKTKRMAATADAKRKNGNARGTGGLIPAILGVRVKLRGARRAGSLRSKLRDWLKSSKTVRSCRSDLSRVSRRAASAWDNSPSR